MLTISEVKFSNKTALFLMLVAYVFAVSVRVYYYNWASGIDAFIWHGTLMINNVDGYYYASGAKDILNHHHILGSRNPCELIPSVVTAYIVKIFPFLTLDQVILWMPAVLGSLIVIPLFLIGRTFKNDMMGFTSALIGGIVWSYYNRTMIGYYDTDMLVIVFLVFIIWEIIEYIQNNNKIMLFIVPITIVLYNGWYPKSKTVLLAVLVMLIVYFIIEYINEKRFSKTNVNNEKYFNYSVFILFFALSLVSYGLVKSLTILLIIYLIYYFKKEVFNNKYILIGIYIITLLLLIDSGTLNLLIDRFLAYFERQNNVHLQDLYFYNVHKTIREASHISYTIVVHRISGNWPLFILSAMGYILILIRYRVMLISLPLVLLGIMAHKLGLRFTIYAVPFFALGFAYLALLISEYVSKLFIDDKVAKISKIVLPLILIVPSLYANINHVINYKTPTTFLAKEVESLDKLSQIAKPEDYVVTWWDYGYPIRYYAGVKTLIDGGNHSGNVDFPVSYALTHNQTAAANIARLDVEYTDKVEVARELGKKLKTEGFIKDMMKRYGYKDPNEFLKALNDPNFKLSEKTRDIYFYFPFRMADIYPTVAVFSSIDLKSGKVNQPFIIATRVKAVGKGGLKFANGIWMDMKGYLHWGEKLIPLNAVYLGLYDKTGKYRVVKQPFHSNSNVVVIWYKPLNKVLILSTDKLDATYVQMFFFENYDPKLFEPVILNPFVKIYKLKK